MRGVRVLARVLAGLAALAAPGCGSDPESGPPVNTLVAVRDGAESQLAFAAVTCANLAGRTTMRAATNLDREVLVRTSVDGKTEVIVHLKVDGDDVLWGSPAAAAIFQDRDTDVEAGFEDLPITRDGDTLILRRVPLNSPDASPMTLDGTLRCTRGHL